MCQKAICLTVLLAGLVVFVPSSAHTDQPADEVKRARDKLEEARKELEKTRQVYQDSVAKKRALEEEVKNLEKKLAKLRQEIAEGKQQREELKKAEQHLKAEREKLDQRLKELQATMEKLRSALPVEKDKRPKIDGKVKEVQEAGAIIVSIGSEAGLKKGDTLEVFRFKPKPLYLGRLEVTEVKAREAVARQIRKRPGGGEPIRAGDEVSTRIGSE
jgi:septal ring factor EnvC (AmiA/AmiB activator)